MPSIIQSMLITIITFSMISLSNQYLNSTPYGKFEFRGNEFFLNDEAFLIVAGEIHYSRIPQEYWRHRIQMVKGMGCNTLSVYVMWNFHEIQRDKFDFQGYMKNLREFLQIAKEEQMWVLIRPGPYVCAEWDFGGQTYWLLPDKAELRSTNKQYVDALRGYVNQIAEQIFPYQITQNGTVIMLQVENEYGYGGLWNETQKIQIPYYTADGAANLRVGHVPGAAIGLNPGINQVQWDLKDKEGLNLPGLSSETYPGWLTHWGEKEFAGKSTELASQEIDFILSHNHSFSIYMIIGGTNFGYWAGANYPDSTTNFSYSGYQPDITSYDYDAPINEQGNTTEKYFAMKNVIQKYVNYSIPLPPPPIPTVEIPEFMISRKTSVIDYSKQMKPIKSKDVLQMEYLQQKFGLLLYRVYVPTDLVFLKGNKLEINELHDYANIYLQEIYKGSLYRGDNNSPVFNFSYLAEDRAKSVNGVLQIDILVEAMGRINFSHGMQQDLKGITKQVLLNGNKLENWEIYQFYGEDANEYFETIESASNYVSAGNVFEGTLILDETNLGDTYLDMSNWSKGYVWVNGKNLGRFWNIGPQQRLYCPGVWLKRGINQIQVFDFHLTGDQYGIVGKKQLYDGKKQDSKYIE